MSIITEIRQQPLHIRKFFMWTMVIITFSFVGFWYGRSAKNSVVATLNGSKPAGQQNEDTDASPFASIGKLLGSAQANISQFVKGGETHEELPKTALPPVPPQKLPLQ